MSPTPGRPCAILRPLLAEEQAEEGGAMDGGSSGARSVARGALAAAVIVAALALTGGSAMANDRSTEVVCVDRSTGAWRASMTFSSIDVHDGHPVVVTFGSAVATLAEPGSAAGRSRCRRTPAVTGRRPHGRGRSPATASSSRRARPASPARPVARARRRPNLRRRNRRRPNRRRPNRRRPCRRQREPPVAPPPAAPTPPGRGRPDVPASVPTPPPTTDRAGPLPSTGLPAVPFVAAAVAVVGLGVLARRWARRRADQLIGD